MSTGAIATATTKYRIAMPLITLADVRALKPVSRNNNNNVEFRYNSAIEESEFKDVRPLLGVKLYQDLIQNSGDANYQALLNGGSYVFENFTYDNPGLNRVLIEFAYARIIFLSTETMTPYGPGVKQYKDTESTPRNRAKELMTEQKKVAMEYWAEVENFLNRNSDDYEFWEDCDNLRRNTVTYKMTHIKGDNNYPHDDKYYRRYCR